MKNEIRSRLHHPKQLEKLYRANKLHFRQSFSEVYPELKGSSMAEFWNERLHYETNDINWGTLREGIFVLLASVLAGIIAKLPAIVDFNEAFFYPRNIGFIVFPILATYFALKNKLSPTKIAAIAGVCLVSVIFINSLPLDQKSDTLLLSCIHLVLVLWSALGFAFTGDLWNDDHKRLSFLKYNGDLVVMTTLILIAGALLSGITIGLFSLIGYNIDELYFQYVGIIGLAAAPIVGTYLTQINPQLVGRVSPVIAKIFSPLVLVMLLIYLLAMINAQKDPYNDRDFLLIFNGLLVGVMALVLFSIAETSKIKSNTEIGILLALSAVTIVVNGIALSAILFRISEWGFTPNRAAVLGGNVLILINLVLVAIQLFRVLFSQAPLSVVGRTIARYLPLYVVWAIVVTFLFPLIFNFK